MAGGFARDAIPFVGLTGGIGAGKTEALAALEHAAGYLRRELALRLQLRHVPELQFAHDKNPDVESRIEFLLKRAKKSRGGAGN